MNEAAREIARVDQTYGGAEEVADTAKTVHDCIHRVEQRMDNISGILRRKAGNAGDGSDRRFRQTRQSDRRSRRQRSNGISETRTSIG